MDYARTLTDSALLLVSQPIGLAVLSHGGDGKLKEQAEAITRFVAIVMMPASAFIFVFAPDIVRMIFQRGAFNALGVELTSEALRGISIGLWASTLGWILLRLLNRANRSTLAAGILVASYLANIGINATSAALQHTHTYGPSSWGSVRLSAASSCVLPSSSHSARRCRCSSCWHGGSCRSR